jgi:hypothetical protein
MPRVHRIPFVTIANRPCYGDDTSGLAEMPGGQKFSRQTESD